MDDQAPLQTIPMQIVRCASCEGWGKHRNGAECPECLGYGVYTILDGVVCYVGYPTNPVKVASHRHLVYTLKYLLTLALRVIGAFGLVSFLILLSALFIEQDFIAHHPLSQLLSALSGLCFVFWMYLSSELGKTSYSLQKVFAPYIANVLEKQKTEEKTSAFVPSGSVLLTFKPIDIADFFSISMRVSVLKALLRTESEGIGALLPETILYQITKRPYFKKTLHRLNIEPDDFLLKILTMMQQQPKKNDPMIFMSPDYKEAIMYTFWYALHLEHRFIWSFAFLLGLGRIPKIEELFGSYNVKRKDYENTIMWTEDQIDSEKMRLNFWMQPYKRKGKLNAGWTSGWTIIADKYSRDLTMAASYGALPRVVGRSKEIDTTLHILDRSIKGHVLLVGQPGTGKSAIIHAVAYRITNDNVPPNVTNKRIFDVNLAAIFSGNQGEEILVAVLRELSATGDVILFIDDIHLFFQGKAGMLNAFSLLRPYIEANVFQVIGTTDHADFKRFLEMDSSFSNFFQVVHVEEPTVEEAVAMVEASALGIERAHGIVISYKSLESAVKLSNKYIKTKALPSKAIDLLDEAAVVCKSLHRDHVDEDIIADLVTKQTGIPVEDAKENEAKKLLNLEKLLHERVIGQQEAVEAVSTAMRRARSGLKKEGKPIAVFLFLGPTGVGKTELAKALASSYFGSEKNIIRLDMSEYQSATDIYKIIGSPGDGTGGYLTEAVRTAPFSMVLLDEFEKANPKIFDLFLQVFDDGRLTDSRGMTIDFSNTIIIATSNAGAAMVQQSIAAGYSYEQMKQVITQELQKYFRPEFINRFDGTIIFRQLTKDEIYQIGRLMVKSIAKQLAEKEIGFEVSDDTLARLVTKGFDPQFGARPMRRVIQEEVENMLADKMLKGEIKKGDVVRI